MTGRSLRFGASWYSSPNRMQNTSARMDAAVVSFGQTMTVKAMVAILFSTPTRVKVVAVMVAVIVTVMVVVVMVMMVVMVAVMVTVMIAVWWWW